MKPGLNETVPAKLPTSARIDSSLPPPEKTKKQQPSPSNEKHSIEDAINEMRPIVVDEEHKKVKVDLLLKDDKRKECGDLVAEHKGLVKLVHETKEAMNNNRDDTTFHDMLADSLKSCIKTMNDLGKKLGHI